MSTLTRRALFGSSAAAATMAAIPAVAACTTASPDAELIRICDQHIVNMHAYNNSDGSLEPEDNPLWGPYCRSYAAIDAARPQTVAGMLAVARAAKAEALQRDGSEAPEDGPASRWAWQLVDDLLRLKGTV